MDFTLVFHTRGGTTAAGVLDADSIPSEYITGGGWADGEPDSDQVADAVMTWISEGSPRWANLGNVTFHTGAISAISVFEFEPEKEGSTSEG